MNSSQQKRGNKGNLQEKKNSSPLEKEGKKQHGKGRESGSHQAGEVRKKKGEGLLPWER